MNFVKTFWAALLAFIAANILLIMLSMLIFSSLAVFFSKSAPVVKSNSVLHIDLRNGISDSPVEDPLNIDFFSGSVSLNKANTLLQVLNAIERAAEDPDITGIYINTKGGPVNMANVEELRNALLRFKESGKFIISYNENYTQTGYYLASVADQVWMNPEGNLMWQGMSANLMFYKGLLEKTGIEVDILRHGTFKSAVEPFMYDKMSPENRLQYEVLLNSIWDAIVGDVAVSRNLDPETIKKYAAELALFDVKNVVSHGFVDALMYEDQVNDILKRMSRDDESLRDAFISVMTEEQPETKESKKKDKLNLVTLADYISATYDPIVKPSKNKIAIVYADGGIIDGPSRDGDIGGETMIGKLAKARKDEDVKAVVLRVNSPGGSALASELMWREVELIREDKPVIVSMGSMAASGGYYISCAADAILADRTTLTGSIGVFGMMPSFGKAFKDKLGITTDVVTTNPNADFGNAFRRLTPTERAVWMKTIEDIYATFVGHVADGRNMTFEAVDKVGEGRVWSGVNAKEIGLVDEFGGLHEAIALAVEIAGVGDDFHVWEVVDQPDNIFGLLDAFGVLRAKTTLKDELGEAFATYNNLKNMVSEQQVLARIPFDVEIN